MARVPRSKEARAHRNAFVREWRARYPKNWPQVKARIRKRSGGQCECVGQCGEHLFDRCEERHGQPGMRQRGVIRLQVCHRNHRPKDVRDENLFDGCPRCHLLYDKQLHADNARRTRNKRKGQVDAIDDLQLREALQALKLDFEGRRQRVGLIPAPDPRHPGHKIRQVFERPPRWYLDLCERWGYSRHRQGMFQRRLFKRALDALLAGRMPRNRTYTYHHAALEVARQAIRDPAEIFGR